MENVTQALFMAFAMFVFLIALTYYIYMIRTLNVTSKTLMYRVDETNKYESMRLAEIDSDIRSSRTVSIDTIIPTLYRYYKESYSVKILDEAGNLMQYFDTTTEGAVMTATSTLATKRTEKQKALISLYGSSDPNPSDNEIPACLFGASWMGNTNKDTKARIDMYISGKSGYINNTFVDYSIDYFIVLYLFKYYKIDYGSAIENGRTDGYIFLNSYKDRKFKETFVQYAYEGDTLSVEGDELETLTGVSQIATKIVITYQLLPE